MTAKLFATKDTAVSFPRWIVSVSESEVYGYTRTKIGVITQVDGYFIGTVKYDTFGCLGTSFNAKTFADMLLAIRTHVDGVDEAVRLIEDDGDYFNEDEAYEKALDARAFWDSEIDRRNGM